jgi:hypothetical protein
MARERMKGLAIILAIWSALGLIGLAIPVVNPLVTIVPAVPFYLISDLLTAGTAQRGLFWDSAHGPPFLNGAGVGLVYVLPGVVAAVLLTITLFSSRRPSA